MAKSDSPKIYAGMLKKELLEIADRLGLSGANRLRKEDLLKTIQAALRRTKGEKPGAESGKEKKMADKKAKDASRDAGNVEKPSGGERAPKDVKGPEGGAKPAKESQEPKEARDATAVEGAKAEGPEEPPKPEASEMSEQSKVTAAKYGLGTAFPAEDLRQVDVHLPGLPEGYGEDRLVLLPRDPDWLYAYWDVKNETKDRARREGGINLAVRLYEHRAGQIEPMAEHWVQEYSRSWYLRVPSPGQEYVAEIGYRNREGGWLGLLRSNVVNVPPVGPSSVVADTFVTITPTQPLWPRSRAPRRAPEPVRAAPPAGAPEGARAGAPAEAAGAEARGGAAGGPAPHEAAYEVSGGARAGFAGSVPWSARGPAGVPGPGGVPGSPWGSAQPLPARGEEAAGERSFWLIADAELIVFGATDPKATVTVGGQKIRLRDDGTFSVRMAFPDGKITMPIVAIAEDGEQRRGMVMRFERATGPDEPVES